MEEEDAASRQPLIPSTLNDGDVEDQAGSAIAVNRGCDDGGEGSSVPSDSSLPPSPSSSSSSSSTVVLFSSLVAVCGSYAFGNAVGYSSPAETGIIDDLGLSLTELWLLIIILKMVGFNFVCRLSHITVESTYSVFGSTLTVGAMLGAVLSGRIADLLGRRGAMWASELFCIAGWLAIAFAKAPWSLDVGRFLGGCGIGLLSYVVPVYIAEITPKNVRGGYTSLNQLMIGFGKEFMFLIGSIVNWRVLALIGTIPCLLQILGLFFIPESPRWLAKTGREKEFEATLQRLRGRNADISQEKSDIRDYTAKLRSISEGGILELFNRKYAYSLTIAVGLMIIQQFGGLNGFTFYATVIFETAGFSSTIGTVAAGLVQIPMTILGVLLIDKCGRCPLLLASTAGACLGCVFTGLSFVLQDLDCSTKVVATLVLIGVLVFLGSFELGLGGIPWIIMSEILPINVKGSAGSLVNLVSWIGSWLVSYTYSYMFEWSTSGTFFIYAGICAAGVVFIAKLVPETKGRALEEIQDSMNHGNSS